jgi:glycosyltransferase involved in cell wall biosynthesis
VRVERTEGPLRLPAGDEGVWLVRAGAWPVRAEAPRRPPPSATGWPLAAIGSLRTPDDPHAKPVEGPIASVYLEGALLPRLQARLAGGEAIGTALEATLRDPGVRAVAYQPIDVHVDAGLRVLHVVTSVQQGGAERLVVDLARALRRRAVTAEIATVGRATRAVLEGAGPVVDLSGWRGHPDALAARLASEAMRFGADVVHAHLLDAREVAALATHGLPVVVTVHNARAGWPEGLEGCARRDVALLVACACSVAQDARTAGLAPAVRTIWNAIDPGSFSSSVGRSERARAWRARMGLGADDLVLLSVANARPQKRLHRLPAIVVATRRAMAAAGIDRDVRLVVAGTPSSVSEASLEADRLLRAQIEAHGLQASVRMLGSVSDVAELYAACDVLVSTSEFEGLSLAQLEALASGLPVVATDVGGARECGARGASMTLVDVEAPPEAYARELLPIAARVTTEPTLPQDFTLDRAAERHVRLYERVAHPPRRVRGGLLLVTNNLSVGGAQSSARRLLRELSRAGVRVRAAVLEEKREDPTPGVRALLAEGIDVLFAPPPWEASAEASVASLLDRVDEDAPDAVLLWNAMAAYKVLLADAPLDTRIYDVSPGEMYFASLDRFFARGLPGLPYLSPRDYGARLAGVVVKYAAESERAAELLGAPVHVIANGVRLDVPRACPGRDRVPLALGTAARLSPQKRLEQLLRALAIVHDRMPPYELRIAGGVEHGAEAYADELRRTSTGLPVVWAGEHDDVTGFLARLDGFAMISEPAGCPNASLEAMAAGLPVVATDVGGAAEQIEDGVTGRLVPRDDPRALGEALVDVARDAHRRAAWGGAGRARVEERFAIDRMVADYRRLVLG